MVKGLNVQSCVSCGAYTLDQLTLERLLGGPTSHWGATPDSAGRAGTPPPVVYGGAPTIPAPPPEAPLPALPGELPPPLPTQQAPVYRPTPLPPARQGIGPPAPPPGVPQSPYPQADPYVPRRSGGGGTMVLALLVLAALGVGTVGAGFVVYQGLQAGTLQPAAETVTPTDLDEVLAQDDGDGDGDEAAEPVEAAKITAEPPEPEPAPKAAPKPPPAPPGNDVRTLVNRGWQQVGTDLNQAAGSFQKALEIRSGDAEANYGYGYVLLQQGNTSGAQPYLCRALDGANVETRRDVTSLLNQYKLTCS